MELYAVRVYLENGYVLFAQTLDEERAQERARKAVENGVWITFKGRLEFYPSSAIKEISIGGPLFEDKECYWAGDMIGVVGAGPKAKLSCTKLARDDDDN